MSFLDRFVPTVSAAAVPAQTVDMASAVAPYNREQLAAFFTGYTATRAEALSVPAVSRCIGIMQTIASLPMHTRNEATGEKVQQPRVITQPDPRIAGSTFWSWIVSDMVLYPVAYAWVMDRYADTGRIRSMERIDPETVTIQTNALGTEIEAYLINGTFVDPSRIVAFNSGNEGLLFRAGRTIQAAVALETAARDFALDPVPPMVVRSNGTSLPADRASKIMTALRTRQRKSSLFLNADVALETHGFDPKAIQLNEGRNYVALELARACGIPAYFIDAQQSTFTYSNALDKRRDLIDFAFRTIMSQIEQRMSFSDFTPAGQVVKFDVDDFLRGNPLERAQVYEILNRIGAMSIDEIREEEDLLL